MNEAEVKQRAFAMPLTSPSYPQGPYRFINREFLTITYETDIDLLREIVPAPLEVSGQVIPVRYKGKMGNYTHAMFLDDLPPIAGGREIWGFPKKLAQPKLEVVHETLLGTLEYGPCRIATATMGYKYETLDLKKVADSMKAPNYLLKIIPHVDGSLRICELVEYFLDEVTIKGAWKGPAQLQLTPHALAPVASLPIRRIVNGVHLLTDLTLPYGRVVHDYLV
ncbi:MAG: acetoacetate decarboxylase [Legionella longbeachae]|nr:acetoacetate decarboxylase [Legionella longbeachae]